MYNLLLSSFFTVLLAAQETVAGEAASDAAEVVGEAAEANPAEPWQWIVFGLLVVFGLFMLSRLAGLADEMTRDRNF